MPLWVCNGGEVVFYDPEVKRPHSAEILREVAERFGFELIAPATPEKDCE